MTLMAASSMAQSSSPRSNHYDRSAETSVAGTVSGVDPIAAPDGTVGVHLEIDTGHGFVTVHVAPAVYVGQQNFFFLKDDRVSVIGARVGASLWARAITKDSAMLLLRNEDGTPRWTPAIEGTDGCGVTHSPLVVTTEK
jgi:hypothetical protein